LADAGHARNVRTNLRGSEVQINHRAVLPVIEPESREHSATRGPGI
jgi:hypothetical protein